MKYAAVTFVKTWACSHFSKYRNPSYDGLDIWPECPRKDWWDKSWWLHSQERVDKGPGSVITSLTLSLVLL